MAQQAANNRNAHGGLAHGAETEGSPGEGLEGGAGCFPPRAGIAARWLGCSAGRGRAWGPGRFI